jgi:hypothetical protein
VDGEFLIWQETVEGRDVARVVSGDCVSVNDDGEAIITTLSFHEGHADLTHGSQDPVGKLVPLLPGATRTVSISLGDWSATYDDVPRPSTALVDMANALLGLGWREVSRSQAPRQSSFEGQRVFTNSANAVCMVSLTKQDDVYQLLTIINSRA